MTVTKHFNNDTDEYLNFLFKNHLLLIIISLIALKENVLSETNLRTIVNAPVFTNVSNTHYALYRTALHCEKTEYKYHKLEPFY